MTTQTKTFIELSDILAVRVQCSKCQSTVTMPITREMSFAGMRHCPNCGKPWLVLEMTSKESEIAACAATIRATSDLLKTWQETLAATGHSGFSLTLEIAQPTEDEE
jgi:DNA replicative helicase MCM subunit Mcm2 (Cdc46/Mcm family)